MTLFFIGFGLLRLLGFVFIVLLLIKAATLIGRKMNYGKINALNLAAERFANGDISADQYREIKTTLKD